ncbi:MAG TPA: thioredoxin family protein [Thermoanaerobaculaceae bacterium]|nr:thioredoxin family protein [Thermoanaerobaculaceae bacterium]
MGRRIATGLLLMATGMAVACGTPEVPAISGPVPWAASLDLARSRAAAGNKLVMVEFYASWCGWCKRLEARTLADERVIRALAAVVPVRLDGEGGGQSEAERLGVRGYPTIVFMAPDGREVGRIPGYLDPEPFLQELSDVLKRS